MVCLMYSGAERAVVDWMHDLAENGTIHFDEAAEEQAFATLHASAARLFSYRPEEIDTKVLTRLITLSHKGNRQVTKRVSIWPTARKRAVY